MKQSFFIPGPLPGMNDFISTGSRFRYNDAKKLWATTIGAYIRMEKIRPVTRAQFHFHWQEKNRLRNPDNFSAIGKKFIFDALQACKIIENDGWKQNLGMHDTWEVSSTPGVMVTIEEVE